MTEPLTIKDLNCENNCNHLDISNVSDSCPNEEICGLHGCTITPEIKSWIEIHGCPNHPLALQVLAKPVILPLLERFVKAFDDYGMDVMDYDFPPPANHRNMMDEARETIQLLKGEK